MFLVAHFKVVMLLRATILVNDTKHEPPLFFIPSPFGAEFMFFGKPKNVTSQLKAKFSIKAKPSCQDHIFVSHMEVCLGEARPLCSS